MVLKRQGGGGANKPPAALADEKSGPKNLELIEHMVEKSLAVNPQLARGARQTGEVVRRLREEAFAKSGSAAETGGAPEQPSATLAEKRRAKVVGFLEEIQDSFTSRDLEIGAREEAVRLERRRLRTQVVDEIADFMALLVGSDSSDTRAAMAAFRPLFQRLGVTELEILALASKRR